MPSRNDALLELLVSEKPKLLRRSARIVGDLFTAEDILQRLWLKLQQGTGTDNITSPRAYLLRLVSNLSIDQRRADLARQRIQAKADAYLSASNESASADRTMIARDELARVMAAMEALAEPTRTMFRLNRFEKMRIADIAVMYGVSTTTVENHLRRALARLREAREGI